MHRRLDDSVETAPQLPHREAHLLLVIDFLRKLLDLHAGLVDDAERLLAEEADAGAAPPVRAAQADR